MIESTRIVLVNPSHPGNIGATARAMKVMGFRHLYLVNPKSFPDIQATARAAGAEDILEQVTVVTDLASALEGCQTAFGMSARDRSLACPTLTPREMASQIARQAGTHHALVFGSERIGLTNDELSLCHYRVEIPTQSEFRSLNLASAVQVIVYELHLAREHENPSAKMDDEPMASVDEMEGFYQQLEQVLHDVDYIDPNHPTLLMQRLRRLFHRAKVSRREFNILRGILSSVQKAKKH